ncbi:MAG: response regulator [Clostridiaceae bacterium]|nr:response regulator [Clostridiaceae bacterium]
MYRLLIVDDEEIIVDGLYEIFCSIENLDLDVYKAYSGEEAIEWLNRTRMDVVLTDIRMPEIDGMQLMDEIRKKWPQCKIIFLTGYDEFEYAYKAIQQNAAGYILKTEDPEKVINAVENAIKDIQNRMKIEDLVGKAREQMSIAMELFQKDYFINLLHENNSMNINKSQFEQLAIPMQHDMPVLLLLGHVDNISGDLSYLDRVQYLYSVKLIIDQYLSSNINSVFVVDRGYRFVLFIQPKELDNANKGQNKKLDCYRKTVMFLKGMLEVIQAACRESLNVYVSFVLSGEPCRWESVYKKYYSLTQLLNFKVGTDIEMLLIDNEIKSNVLNVEPEVPELQADTEALEMLLKQKNLDTIELYLETGQRDRYFEALSELIEPLKTIKSRNSSIAIEAYYKVALCILSYINRCKFTEKIAFYIDQGRLMRIDMFNSWDEAADYIYQISDIIFRLQKDEQKKKADDVINYIQKYVMENLSENLSLVKIAEQVHFNPSYLSRLYKQVTGINLSDFIDNARVKEAKRLLQMEDIKIHKVAKMVGYDTTASFTRFFKKVTGFSPQVYQSLFKTGERTESDIS